jgi:hypothetical protein
VVVGEAGAGRGGREIERESERERASERKTARERERQVLLTIKK